jgi:transposase
LSNLILTAQYNEGVLGPRNADGIRASHKSSKKVDNSAEAATMPPDEIPALDCEVCMPGFALPYVPAGSCLEVAELGAAPIVHRFIELLDLPAQFEKHLPPRPGPQPDLSTSTVLCVLIANFLLSRMPLYGISDWAAAFAPEHLGLPAQPQRVAALNDDRCGRALEHLFLADRSTLLTQITLSVVRRFSVLLETISQDTTSLSSAGEHASQPPEDSPDRPKRLTHGFNKDHRPDFVQLVYDRCITADGGVPILCKIRDGNTSDDSVHRENWLDLVKLIGHTLFLYVADSKLCTKENMTLIDQKKGRFLTVMPKTRAEYNGFRQCLQAGQISWTEVCRKPHPRKKKGPVVVISGYEEKSAEGFRLLWYHSPPKEKRDRKTRNDKLAKTKKILEGLRPRGRGKGFASEEAARAKAEKVLEKSKTKEWLRVNIVAVETTRLVQTMPGRPGANTLYREEKKTVYRILAEEDRQALTQAEKCDGIFPLMTNDKSLTQEGALKKYKYQAYSEKRHQQLKSVFKVTPLWLKTGKRIESLVWLYHLVELIQALIERTVRQQMKAQKVKSLRLYHEGRPCKKPTTELIRDALSKHKRYRLLSQTQEVLHEMHDPVSEPMRHVIEFLGVDLSTYGLTTGGSLQPCVSAELPTDALQ